VPRAAHLEIWVDDPRRAATFQQQLFGWKVNRWDGPIEFFLI
jgi:predicted enzyme related to lactoylglutathione lyase